VGASNKISLLTEKNLLNAFAYIDFDKNGVIKRDDMKVFLNVKNEYFLGNLVEEADDDCDGGLNLKEFMMVMNKVIK
jgi:Ca2+-binding EF-hand superfamily protein